MVSGCASVPAEDDAGASPQADIAAPATNAVPRTSGDIVQKVDPAHTGSAEAAPLSGAKSANTTADKPIAKSAAGDLPSDNHVSSAPANVPDAAATSEAVRITDERRGLGLVLPPSVPMSSIDGLSRPWDVPEIPQNLQQDPYRSSDQQGLASWYGGQFHGRKTANGERFDKEGYTAAHKTLPFGTQICVRSMVTGKSVVVRVNDRGPYSGDRIIDLSQGAAQELGMLGLGIKPVELWALDEDADRCPSFVMAGKRGGGKLAGPVHGKTAVRGNQRVHQTLTGNSAKAPTAKAKAAPAKKIAGGKAPVGKQNRKK